MAIMSGKGLITFSLGTLLIMAMMLGQPAEASSFVAYSGPGCRGSTATLNACGCSNIPSTHKGGYYWTYNGQTGAAYNSEGCTGVAHTHFSNSVGGCSAFGWSSFFIQC